MALQAWYELDSTQGVYWLKAFVVAIEIALDTSPSQAWSAWN